MITKNFTTGEIEEVFFDPGSRCLEVQRRNERIVAQFNCRVQFIPWQATRLLAK
jgi:hypothetical protein